MKKFEKKLALFIAIATVLSITSCSKDDGLASGNDETYKFRLEITAKSQVENYVYFRESYYLVPAKNGLVNGGKSNMIRIPNSADSPSPFIKDIEIPRNFESFVFFCGFAGDFYGIGNYPESDMVCLKFFVNDKLLLSYDEKKRHIVLFLYKSDNKIHVDINYTVSVFVFDRLD